MLPPYLERDRKSECAHRVPWVTVAVVAMDDDTRGRKELVTVVVAADDGAQEPEVGKKRFKVACN